MPKAHPIVASDRFILATRDTGYRGLSNAVAELVDNSLQAGARYVQVFVREERGPTGREVSIGVLDDGAGMTEEALHAALQFGGSERFDDRSGIGRFGMGLPNSSVSQTRRVEILTWRVPGAVTGTYLDVDEIAKGLLVAVPAPATMSLPEWVQPWAGEHGTLVLWLRCDRLDRRKASTVAATLREPLGRMYRRALWAGTRITVNGEPLVPVDPLFHDPVTGRGGATQYGGVLCYEMRVPGTGGDFSPIYVRFTELPIEEWYALPLQARRQLGVIGGGGVSVMRGGREVDFGWYCMGRKRRENYDDWWRCEIEFSPMLDELFGVTHSKQGITPTTALKAVLEPDLEATARILNSRVRRTFERLKVREASLAIQIASTQDRLLPPIHPKSLGRGPDSPIGECPIPQKVALDGLSYKILQDSLPTADFFDVRLEDKTIVLVLNREHSFYSRVYLPCCGGVDDRARVGIESLLLSAARATLGNPGIPTPARRDWGDALAAFLDAYRPSKDG